MSTPGERLMAAGVLGTPACPAAELRAQMCTSTGAEQDAVIDRYLAYIQAELNLVAGALDGATPAVSDALLEAHATALAAALPLDRAA